MIRGSLDPIFAALDGIAERAQYLPPAAAEVKKALDESNAAGTSPTGQKWAPRVKDGGRAYANASEAVDVRVAGPTIIVELTGVEVFGHYGARGAEKRKMIPEEVDERLGDAIRRGVAKPFKERAK